jgi:recombination protein RecR
VQRIPEPLKNLVDQLSHLPGLGPKSAMRAAMALLKWPESEVRRLGKGLFELRDTLHLCSRCGALSDSDPCPICADSGRDPSHLCLVAEWDSMLTMEEGNFFRGQYFILGGLLAPLDNSPAESLDMQRLFDRLGEGEVKEIILALGATADAEATASYVREQVGRRFPDLRVSRLAQGIPLGAEVRFMDRETLRQSLRYRQEL